MDLWKKSVEGRGRGPKRSFDSPVAVLMRHRQRLVERLERPSYTAPSRITVSKDYMVAWPAEMYPFPEGVQLAAPGAPILRDEAYLTGAFGRQGVQDNLDMVVSIAMYSGATPVWIEDHIERPALEMITALFGRGRGRPVETHDDRTLRAEARRKRIVAKAKRGEALLDKHLGPDWQNVVFHPYAAPFQEEGEDGD